MTDSSTLEILNLIDEMIIMFVKEKGGEYFYMSEFPIIDEELCIGCKACVAICLHDVIAMGEDEKAHVINPEVCQKKEECAKICPTEAITLPWKT